ncbi:hypothetical protein [Chitinophaga flava]|uniref:Chitin-binding type-3 domain-containing protein n=1 Tax=Chitinophaga flava TaxID=2259036 RepID=A0A365Y7A1_9BACT|nr:hypothetical protein [Chitinophaga flava]RBL93864.1 hypothetical protein DF182_15335 [Chitinophaga flava]
MKHFSKSLLLILFMGGFVFATTPTNNKNIRKHPKPSRVSASTGTPLCAGVLPWNSSVAYYTGYEVVYNGHKWKAKWYSYNNTPNGDPYGVWEDEGACN